MPWWYCLMAEAHRTGRPVLRPLLWLDPRDEIAVRCGDQFLVGDSLLVAPILRQGARVRSVYLPAGTWYDFWTGVPLSGKRHILAEAPLDRIPLYVRAGAILPAGAVRQFTEETAPSTVDLNLWWGGEGTLTWWEGDPRGGNPAEAQHFGRQCSWTQRDSGHLLAFAASEGALKSNVRFWRPCIHGASSKPRVVLDGREVPLRLVKSSGAYQFTVPNSPQTLELEIKTCEEGGGRG